ncbi:MAG: hypothetical protein K2P99_03455 [Burkholderiales bacterium]|nr:hypothetical protein [Burkholderiales bacterium]
MEVNNKKIEDLLKSFKNMSEEQIEYSDTPEVSSLVGWQPNPFFKPIKKPISVQLDIDIITWLKMHGSVSGFLNKVCREKMLEEYQKLASTTVG